MAGKNLGTLTLDLVAKVGGFVQGMDAAERKADKWRKQVDKNLKAVGSSFAAMSAASAGALTYIVQDLAQSSKELQQFARVSDTTTQEFQKMAFGAKRYGVEQDKVADILKDTNDKIGDFLQTGGGPLADFFDDIAPAIGVTAEQFAGLGGPQALQLYVDSLDKANLSQKEMTFFMEAIASDASLLLPLLKDGGREFKALGDEAERTGNVLSDVELEQLDTISKSVGQLTSQFTGMKNEVALAAVPAVNDLIALLSEESTVEAAKTLGTALVTVMTAAAEAIRGTIEVTQFLSEEIAAVTAGIVSDDIARLEQDAEKINGILNGGLFAQTERVRFFGPDGVVEFLNNQELQAKLDEINAAIKSYYSSGNNKPKVPVEIGAGTVSNAGGGSVPVLGREGVDDGAAKAVEAIDQQIAALQLQAETFGKTAEEAELYRLKVAGATEAQLLQAEGLLGSIAANEAITDKQEKAAAAIESLRAQYEQLGDAVAQADDDQVGLETRRYERLKESLAAEYQAIVDGNALTDELQAEHKQALEDAEYEHQARLGEIRQEARDKELEAEAEKRKQLADGYSALLDVVGEYYGGMDGKQAAYARAAIKLGQTLLDEDKRKALQGVVANTSETAMKAYNAFAGIPYVGPALGIAASGAVYVAGAAAAAKITGMAHDGIDSVPEDGTWLLQKGERVTTAETSAKLDGLLERIDRNMIPQGGGGGQGGATQLGVSLAPGMIVESLQSDDNFERLVVDIQRKNEG